MSELINKLNQYRSMGDKFYPEDILVIEDVWELLDEIERLNNIINEALELIYANAYDTERKECIDDLWGNIEELVDILKGNDKE